MKLPNSSSNMYIKWKLAIFPYPQVLVWGQVLHTLIKIFTKVCSELVFSLKYSTWFSDGKWSLYKSVSSSFHVFYRWGWWFFTSADSCDLTCPLWVKEGNLKGLRHVIGKMNIFWQLTPTMRPADTTSRAGTGPPEALSGLKEGSDRRLGISPRGCAPRANCI